MAHPLKVEARVRIPLGLPAKSQCRDRVNRRGARVGVEAAAVATDRRSPSDTHSCSTRTCSGRPARGSACGTVVDGVGGRRHCSLCHGGLRGLIEMGRPSPASPSAVDGRCYGRALALADQSMARRWGTVSVVVTACSPVSWSVAVSEDPAGCQQPAAMALYE